MLLANVIIMPILQREKARHQLILFKTCNSVTHPASHLGLLLPLNGEAPPTDDTSAQSSIPQQNNTTQERRKEGMRPRMRRNPVSSEASAQRSFISMDLSWDGHYELRIREAKPSTMPASARTNFRNFQNSITWRGGQGEPSQHPDGQPGPHLQFHQKVIIRRDVIQNAVSS